MARLTRITPVGVPVHIIQRGNNHQDCFSSGFDMMAYMAWLKEYSKKYSVDVHAWVLMPDHVHILCTPQQNGGISQMMQSLGRRYVRYFNVQYQRTGTLWEGRYKSCLVQAKHYLLEVYKYIEMNPVRANLVNDPADYSWSSYRINTFWTSSELCTPHPEYMKLGETKKLRLENYQSLFTHQIDEQLLEDIRQNTNKGMALGNSRFKEEIEKLTGRRLKPLKAGRRKGWRKGNEVQLHAEPC